jgi:hypothetical protein
VGQEAEVTASTGPSSSGRTRSAADAVKLLVRYMLPADPGHPLRMCFAMMSFWISLVPSKMRNALTWR